MTKRIAEFDLWRPGYGGAVVNVYIAGTTTLASIYTDEALSVAADNPQTLEAMEAEGGVRYGKFTAPLYTGQSYYLSIDGIENTGTVRPDLSDLDGEDASAALVIPSGSAYPVTVAAVAGRQVNVANFGVFVEGSGGVAATNTATMELAIAALPNGGFVNVPVGSYKVNDFDVPEGVIVKGQGVNATTLLSVMGSESFTIVGEGGGFNDITLDGSSLSAGSIGVLSSAINGIVFENVTITRFETGLHVKGGSGFSWVSLSIINVETAAKLFGDGAAFEDLLWAGGFVSTATTLGVYMSYEDHICHNINFIGVGFEDCTEPAVKINGAQEIQFDGCWFFNNTHAVLIQDDTDVLTPTTAAQNDAIIVQFIGGRIDGGDFEATGTAQDIVLKDMKLKNLAFVMSTPLQNFIVLENCYEESVTISGEATKLIRSTTNQNGSSFGVTTGNAATKAWGMALKPGQVVYVVGKVIAKGRNVVERSVYHIAAGFYRPGSTLAYDTQTANFTAGTILTGASSGAKARIQDDTDGGATGTLVLIDIEGEFVDNEIITDDNGTPGSAKVNGALVHQNVVIDTVGVTSQRTAYETDAAFACLFAASAGEVVLNVTGAAAKTVEWTAHVDVVSS